MKLLLFLTLLIAVANAMVIRKNKDGIVLDIDGLPTPTSTEPTKIQQKRAKITEYQEFQNITIFKEGDTEWDQDWFESSWTVPEGNKVIDGLIEVHLTNNAGFSLQSKTLQSQYGYISFDFWLSVNDGQTELNFISFDEGDYVNQGKYSYEGGWKHIEQEIKNHNKGTFISSIKRFAWQNYGNEKDFTLRLRNIVFRDIKVNITKYDKVIPFIDEENCALNQRVDNFSPSDEAVKFEVINGVCTMIVRASESDPAILKLDKKISGGKLDIVARTSIDDSILAWYAVNTEDPDVEEVENSSFSLVHYDSSYPDEQFETEDEYDALKLISIEDNPDIVFYITKFNFHPIVTEEDGPSYDITRLEEPDVILDSDGLHWAEASWGLTDCKFQSINNAMECTFEGRQGDWPAFAFQTSNSYNAGTLVVNMKVLNPDQNINILVYDTTENYRGIHTFKATTEYATYEIPIPTNEFNPTYKFAIQEASQQDNTYYIRSIVYYPSYIPLHGESTSKPKPTPSNSHNDEIDDDNHNSAPDNNGNNSSSGSSGSSGSYHPEDIVKVYIYYNIIVIKI